MHATEEAPLRSWSKKEGENELILELHKVDRATFRFELTLVNPEGAWYVARHTLTWSEDDINRLFDDVVRALEKLTVTELMSMFWAFGFTVE